VFGEQSLNLSCLTTLIREIPAYHQLIQDLGEKEGEHRAVIIDATKPYLLAALYKELCLPMLWVVSTPEEAKRMHEQLSVWCGNETHIIWFPEPDTLPYEKITTDPSTVQQRLQVLSTLHEYRSGFSTEVPLIIASVAALVRKTVPHSDFIAACHILERGAYANPSELIARWTSMGYQRESLVQVPGTMSQRGGILDIYPLNSELPVRVELFGNEIDSIRLFDPESQRSLERVESITLIPAQEAAGSDIDTIIDYFPSHSLIVMDEPGDIKASLVELDTQANELRQSQIEKGEILDALSVPYFIYPQLEVQLDRLRQHLVMTRWPTDDDAIHLSFTSAPRYGGQLGQFFVQVERLLKQGRRVIVISHQAARLSELFEEEGIFVSPLSDIEHAPSPGTFTMIHGSLPEGWTMGENSVLFTDAEIFGFVKQRRLIRKRTKYPEKLLPELSPGDYAVHVDHGIARFNGMTRMRFDDVEREYLTLEYAAGDRLHVPTDQADRVSLYIGSGGEPPALSRLSTQEWDRVKQRVKESTRETARELLALYAAREVIHGFAFSADSPWQQELEASFPYIETPDQVEAVQRVKEDMEKPRPTDRLVCGDVGYGKTEVALRAAFKAVMDGKQVAMLVPTTVLAQQHFTTFKQRLAAFPVKVEMLSRFRSEKEQQAILRALTSGAIDICIGTHRLLQKDVAFKDLGLVIIDEEQRFGVAHKERLKKMRKKVDVLTLSATPIPRTLHMSLAGVRDMSIMETPPEDRLPIKTVVGEYNESLIREAIIRELERNGQVFFVHNRVQSIERVAYELRELVPEAKIAIGHGQMREEQLEKTMLEFIKGKVDVLVCTTIIESGLDISNVNTLIIDEADKLGLAQLYQLRGRVGRGSNRAYAYFLYDQKKHLSLTAIKRLQTIFDNTDLGSGFRIAMKDLEIRGAGNLLGTEQSGYIAAVGFGLYCQLLKDAVEELKVKQSSEDQLSTSLVPAYLPAIDLPLSAYIPEDYVPDLATRLFLYQRLAKIGSLDEVEHMQEEFKDRFGKLPSAVKNLLYVLNIKTLAAQGGVESIFKEGGEIVIRVKEGMKMDRETLGRTWQGLKIGTSQLRLDMKLMGNRWRQVLEGVIRELGENQGKGI